MVLAGKRSGVEGKGSLVIVRAGGFWKDHIRAYEVEVDGTSAGTLSEYEVLTVPVAPGPHEVQVKIDFFGSRKLSISVQAGSKVRLVCSAGRVSGFSKVAGYVKLWEGQLTEIAPPSTPPVI